MKIFKKVLNIFSYVIAAILVVFTIYAVVTTSQGKEVSIFGNKFYVVKTESMVPTIKVDTVILSKEKENKNLDKGTIITFTFSDNTKIPNTHRIVGYYYSYLDEEGKEVFESTYDYDNVEDFKTANPNYTLKGYRTQGDNPDCKLDLKPVLFEDIRGVYVKNLVVISFLYKILSSFFGFLLLIIIPLLILLITQIISVVKAKNKLKLEEELKVKEEERLKLEEKLKEEAINEYLKKENKE